MRVKFSKKRFLILICIAVTIAGVNYTLYKELSKYDNVIRINMSKFHDLAEEGYASAQYALGNMYGVRAHEYKYFKEYHRKKSAAYHEQAAQQGHIKAQYQLALYYRDGYGVEQDEQRSGVWLFRAANQGHTESQYLFALHQAKKKEHKDAKKWLALAAANGHNHSRLLLKSYF